MQLLVHVCVLLSRAQVRGTENDPEISKKAGLECTEKEAQEGCRAWHLRSQALV